MKVGEYMQTLRGKLFLSGMDENAAALARKWGLGLELTDFCEARKLEEPAAMEAARARCSGVGSLWLHAPYAELSPCASDPRVREVVMLRFRQTVQAALALGIGVQNFPEGAAVALPVYQSGKSKRRAFWTGVLSGAVEPLFGALVVLAAAGIHALMPWLLSFAAGAMLYVVAEELLPRAGGRRGTCGFLVGFLLMMILDVALG